MNPLRGRYQAVGGPMTARGFLSLLAAVALFFALAGCAKRSFEQIQAEIETHGHYIAGVPFVPLHDEDCGPAALASVFAYWNHAVDLSEITAAVYIPNLRGSLPMDMDRYARSQGFSVSAFAGNRERLIESVRADRPVICLLDLGFSIYRQPHYVTIIGFEAADGFFVMHDGEKANRIMRYADFEKAWARAGNWMIVVTPKQAR